MVRGGGRDRGEDGTEDAESHYSTVVGSARAPRDPLGRDVPTGAGPRQEGGCTMTGTTRRRGGGSCPAWLAAVAAWQLVCAAAPASGQQWQTLPREEQQGVIVDVVGPGMLQVRLPKEGATIWTVTPGPNVRVEITGAASREMLQPGQFVTASVSIDEKGAPTEPVSRLVFPGGGVPGVTTPGIGDQGGKRLAGRRPAGMYLVSGPIKQVKEDLVTIQAGREKFEITVPETAELIVNTSDIGLVGRGDAVDVEGRFLQRGQLQASSLLVRLANPVSPPPKKGARRPDKATP